MFVEITNGTSIRQAHFVCCSTKLRRMMMLSIDKLHSGEYPALIPRLERLVRLDDIDGRSVFRYRSSVPVTAVVSRDNGGAAAPGGGWDCPIDAGKCQAMLWGLSALARGPSGGAVDDRGMRCGKRMTTPLNAFEALGGSKHPEGTRRCSGAPGGAPEHRAVGSRDLSGPGAPGPARRGGLTTGGMWGRGSVALRVRRAPPGGGTWRCGRAGALGGARGRLFAARERAQEKRALARAGAMRLGAWRLARAGPSAPGRPGGQAG